VIKDHREICKEDKNTIKVRRYPIKRGKETNKEIKIIPFFDNI